MNLALRALLQDVGQSIEVELDRVRVLNEASLRAQGIDALIHAAVFGMPEQRAHARWLIWETAQALNIRPASMHELYVARGNDRVPATFTVPALNIRAMVYDSARAAFRAAIKAKVGAMIFELARSEMVYTNQRPAEYTSAILAAAIKEGFRGLVFLQGDHYQIIARNYLKNTDEELNALKHLIDESLKAGFYNFDIDTSTLVDYDKPLPDAQQCRHCQLSALLTDYIRTRQPHGVTPAVGAEIGEGSPRNSDEHELRAFMAGFHKAAHHRPGLCKISVHAGTTRGGVVLPDGSLAKPAVDFDLLRALSQIARQELGLGGVMQHGASTLPDEAFDRFIQAGAIEVHLGTGFQNLLFDLLPFSISREIKDWVFSHLASEHKPGDTDEQFYYKARKLAIGPFKQRLWSLPDGDRAQVRMGLETRFAALFKRLRVEYTQDMVMTFVSKPDLHTKPQDFAGEPYAIKTDQEETAD